MAEPIEPPQIPSREDLATVDWRSMVCSQSASDCQELWTRLHIRFGETTEPSERAVQRLILHVAGLVVRLRGGGGEVIARMPGLGPEDLTPGDLQVLNEIVDYESIVPDLRARILDVFFLHKWGDRVRWQATSQAYLDAASKLFEVGQTRSISGLLARSWTLAVNMKRPHEKAAVTSLLDRLLKTRSQDGPTPQSLALLEFRMQLPDPDFGELAAICSGWARASEPEPVVSTFTREALRLEGACWHKCGKPVEARRAALESAETYVRDADAASALPHMGPSNEAHFLREAIHALRKLDGTKQRRDQLHTRMLEVQKRIPEGYRQICGPTVNFDDVASEAASSVHDLNLNDALRTLASFPLVPDIDDVGRTVAEQRRDSPLLLLIPRSITDERGRVIQRVTSTFDGDCDDPLALATTHHGHNVARSQRELAAIAYITPARKVIAAEHNCSLNDVVRFLAEAPLVPDSRRHSLSVALHAGLKGDFATCVQVLVPQLEHSIRAVIEARGGEVSTMDDNGVQNWMTLGSLLDATEAKSTFGPDILFALQGILGRDGSNLRNQVAHGLCDDAQLASSEVVYLWWLTLHLCVFCATEHLGETSE